MNAVPDLRLILFKELQAILHVATATVMPGLNHFEAYWTVFPCETIHRAINQCSLCCEILLFPCPGVSVRDRAESQARGCKQGRDTQLPSPPLSANLCRAYRNKNPFFLNLSSNCPKGRFPEQSKGKMNHTPASLSRKEAAGVVWDTDTSTFEGKREKWSCMYLQGCTAHSLVPLNAINWDNGTVFSLPHNVESSTPSCLHKFKGKKYKTIKRSPCSLVLLHISKIQLILSLTAQNYFLCSMKGTGKVGSAQPAPCTQNLLCLKGVKPDKESGFSLHSKTGTRWRQCSTSSLSK